MIEENGAAGGAESPFFRVSPSKISPNRLYPFAYAKIKTLVEKKREKRESWRRPNKGSEEVLTVASGSLNLLYREKLSAGLW